MKRFHVHVAVEDLSQSVRFYSSLFGADPTVLRSDYAKWMLDDPKINFAISHRARSPGLNHLGFQVESADELSGMKSQLQAADSSLVEQAGAACCYSRSDKYWVTDPSGIAWETFHTLGAIPVYGEDASKSDQKSACCVPLAAAANDDNSPCCVPSLTELGAKGACCQ